MMICNLRPSKKYPTSSSVSTAKANTNTSLAMLLKYPKEIRIINPYSKGIDSITLKIGSLAKYQIVKHNNVKNAKFPPTISAKHAKNIKSIHK